MVTSTPTSTSTCGEEKEEEDYKITSVPPWLRPTSVPAPPVNNRKHCTPEAGKKQKKRLKVKPKKGREFIPTPPPPCTWEYLNSLKEIPAPDTRPSSGFVDLGSIFTVNWAKVFCRHNWQYALSCFVTETREELIKIVEDACFSKKKSHFLSRDYWRSHVIDILAEKNWTAQVWTPICSPNWWWYSVVRLQGKSSFMHVPSGVPTCPTHTYEPATYEPLRKRPSGFKRR